MNHPRQHFSDEILNAYIDGELSSEDSRNITEAMEHDDLLRRRVAELHRISDLVRMAFSEDTATSHQANRRSGESSTTTLWRAAATIAFIGLGALLSWHIIDHRWGVTTLLAPLTTDADTGAFDSGPVDRTAGNRDSMKVMFHVGRKDMALFEKVLAEVESLLSTKDAEQPIFVRVIASHGGLSLFGTDMTRNAERVRNIELRYEDRITFVGCGETYEQWRKTRSEKTLMPEMVMVDSGVRELLRNQHRGWTFVPI